MIESFSMGMELSRSARNFEASAVRLGSGQQTLIASCNFVGEFIDDLASIELYS